MTLILRDSLLQVLTDPNVLIHIETQAHNTANNHCPTKELLPRQAHCVLHALWAHIPGCAPGQMEEPLAAPGRPPVAVLANREQFNPGHKLLKNKSLWEAGRRKEVGRGRGAGCLDWNLRAHVSVCPASEWVLRV